MRIGLIIYGDLDYPSGGFLYDRKLVEHLKRKGHQIIIISLPWLAYVQCFFHNFDASLLHKIEEANLDILLQDELNHPSLFLINRRIKAKIGLPIVSIVHHLRSSEKGSFFVNRIFETIERRYLNSLDAIIANSETSLNTVKVLVNKKIPMLIAKPGGNRFNQPFSRKHVKSRVYGDGPINIMFLGALIKRKSPHLILDAIIDLPKGTFRAFFAGNPDSDPNYTNFLFDKAARHKVDDYVDFLGHLPENELVEIFNKCHVLIVPSSYEGYGIAYVEAMGFGLPAIARKAGASGEIIEHEQNGFLLETDGSDEIAELLVLLQRDRDLLFQMSLSARKRYEGLPSWSTSMDKIEEFLINIYRNKLPIKQATSASNG